MDDLRLANGALDRRIKETSGNKKVDFLYFELVVVNLKGNI